MANSLENAIARTRVLAGLTKARGLDDRLLLERFSAGDESAFTVLVERHGGLVMGVCRRVLRHTQDAEDAFQATFIVLAKKAGKIAWQESIAGWLHGVACRIAFQIRREQARRRLRNHPLEEPAVDPPDPAWSEIKPALDEELDRLPARYRMPLILCCLEGKSRDEAAAALGWSVGSVKGRLERGRELLRSRLARRGLTLSAGLAALLVIGESAGAAVPLSLSLATVRAGLAMSAGQTTLVSSPVLSLAQGALHAMFMSKIKIAAAVACAVLTIGLGGGYATHHVLAGTQRDSGAPANQRGHEIAAGQRNEPGAAETQTRSEGGERGGREAGNFHTGLVTEIDAAKKTITFQTGGRGEAPSTQTFELAKNVKVTFITGRKSKEGKLADVPLKTVIRAKLDGTKKIVEAIEVTIATTASGVVSEIGADSITLTSGGRGGDEKSATYALAKDVKAQYRLPGGTGRGEANITPIKLADVTPKTAVTVQLDDELKVVQTITVNLASLAGTVQSADAKKLTLLVRPARGEDVMLNVAKDAKIMVNGKAAELGDIAVGAEVHVLLSPDRSQALFVQTPPSRGRE